MLGRAPLVASLALAIGRVAGATGAGARGVPGSVSAAARMASPAPAMTPPASRPPLRNVRRSTLLCSFGSMLSMRALILGPAVALGLGVRAAPAAAGQSGPTCTPASLDNSALQDGLVTVSPVDRKSTR